MEIPLKSNILCQTQVLGQMNHPVLFFLGTTSSNQSGGKICMTQMNVASQLVCLLGRVDPHGLCVVERGLDGAADEGWKVLHAGTALPPVPVEHPVCAQQDVGDSDHVEVCSYSTG